MEKLYRSINPAKSITARTAPKPSRPKICALNSAPIWAKSTPPASGSGGPLIGRGVGVDTELLISHAAEKESGSTIIGVNAELHNDEVTEFPPTASSALVEFVQYLTDSNQTVFEVFRSMDLDESGKIDSKELLAALEASDINELNSIESAELVELMDLDGDGELNLPELDIAIAQIKRDHGIVSSSEEE